MVLQWKYRRLSMLALLLVLLPGCASRSEAVREAMDTWTASGGTEHGQVLFTRQNLVAAAPAGRAAYPFRVAVAVPFHNPNEYGLPATEEAVQIDLIEDQLVAALKDTKSVHVLVLTSAWKREFVFYTSEPERAREKLEALRAAALTHEIRYVLSEDPDWSVYSAF